MCDVECTQNCKKSICDYNALDRHDFWLPVAVVIVATSLLNAQITYPHHHRMETTSFPRKQFSFIYFDTRMENVTWDWTQFFFSIIILFFCSLQIVQKYKLIFVQRYFEIRWIAFCTYVRAKPYTLYTQNFVDAIIAFDIFSCIYNTYVSI